MDSSSLTKVKFACFLLNTLLNCIFNNTHFSLNWFWFQLGPVLVGAGLVVATAFFAKFFLDSKKKQKLITLQDPNTKYALKLIEREEVRIKPRVENTLYKRKKYLGVQAYFIVKTLEIWQVSINFKLVKLDDGSIVDLRAIPDCDFAFGVAILHFVSTT